jgi:hemolysin activation/secretion protein
LITNSDFIQELILGYDFKQVSVRSKGKPPVPFQHGADINQFMIGYDLGQKGKRHKVSFVAELYGSFGSMTTWDHTKDYESIRSGAKPGYAYLKVSHSLVTKLNSVFLFSYDISGQATTTPLLPSEQLTLTGYQAVRGFEERIVSVDDGIIINASLETVNYSLGKAFGLTKKAYDELHFLLFFDAAWGVNNQKGSELVCLASIGPGVKYQIDRWFSAHFDYGFQLWHGGFKNPTDSRYNFGLTMSY